MIFKTAFFAENYNSEKLPKIVKFSLSDNRKKKHCII